MEERKFKSGYSVAHHCRTCKGLLYEDEEDNSICVDCIQSKIYENMSKFLRNKVLKHGSLASYLESKDKLKGK